MKLIAYSSVAMLLSATPVFACYVPSFSTQLTFTAPDRVLAAELQRTILPKGHDVLLVGNADWAEGTYPIEFGTYHEKHPHGFGTLAAMTFVSTGKGAATLQLLTRRGRLWTSFFSTSFDPATEFVTAGTRDYLGIKQPLRMFSIRGTEHPVLLWGQLEIFKKLGYASRWPKLSIANKADYRLYFWSGGNYHLLNRAAEVQAFVNRELIDNICFTGF